MPDIRTAFTSYLKGGWAVKAPKIPELPLVPKCISKPPKCQVLTGQN